MSSMEERVAYLEGRFEDHVSAIEHLREDVTNGFQHVEGRFEHVDRRFESLDQKIDRNFTWLVGIQVAVLVAVVGALIGTHYR